MSLNDPEKIYSLIKEQTGKSDEELNLELQAIKDKYQGLLSDVGANIMLAKQLKVNLDLEKKTSSVLEIKDLNSSLSSVSIYCRIRNLPPVRTYKTKDGSTGKLQTIFVQDNTGSIKLNLWQDLTSLVKELNLKKNDLILVKDAFVNEYNEKLDLSLRHGGQIIVNPENAPAITEINTNYKALKDISEVSEELIDTIGRITNIYPANEFEDKNTGRKKKVLNFNISDGEKNLRAVAWSPWAEIVEEEYSAGDLIKLNDVRIKEGLYDLELYVNWNSGINKNPKTDLQIPELSKLISKDYKEQKIEDLEDGNNYKIQGVVISVGRNNLRYFKCPNCKERVHLINDDFICEACNEKVDPIVNLFANIEIDDGTGIIRATMFGKVVEDFFEINKEDLKKDISDEDKEELFSEIEDKVISKKVDITGRAKINDFSSKLEFLINSISVSS